MNFSVISLACIVLYAAAAVNAVDEYDIVVKVEGNAFVCVGVVLPESTPDELVLGVDGKVYSRGSSSEEQDKSVLWNEVDPSLNKNITAYIRKIEKPNTNLWRRVSRITAVKDSPGSQVINFHCSEIQDQADQDAVTRWNTN